MSAEVTILVDEVNDVLRLPVHSVLESGGKKFCYVKTPAGTIEKRELVTGLNNYKFVEIKPESNLKVGELVVVNPRPVAEKRGDLQGNVYIDPAEGLKLPDRNGPARRPTRPRPTSPPPPASPAAPARSLAPRNASGGKKNRPSGSSGSATPAPRNASRCFSRSPSSSATGSRRACGLRGSRFRIRGPSGRRRGPVGQAFQPDRPRRSGFPACLRFAGPSPAPPGTV
jgi:hypothetical protein